MLLSYFEGTPITETRKVIPTTLLVRASSVRA
jgi:hypothetical protein